jgi:hypothetical protein
MLEGHGRCNAQAVAGSASTRFSMTRPLRLDLDDVARLQELAERDATLAQVPVASGRPARASSTNLGGLPPGVAVSAAVFHLLQQPP